MTSQHLKNILEGDTSSIQELYSSIFQSVKNFVLKNSGQVMDAEDIFQEALVILFRISKREDFKLSCSLETYIYSICRNIWLDRLRRKSKYIYQELDDNHEEVTLDIVDVIQLNERNNLYQRHFLLLKEDCKKVLEMFFEGSSMLQIKEAMGYSSEKYARKRKFLCKNFLVDSIKKDGLYKEFSSNSNEYDEGQRKIL